MQWAHENVMGARECIEHEKAIGVQGCKGHARMQWAHGNAMIAQECNGRMGIQWACMNAMGT